jgi:ribosomal protein L37AE/L43A
MKGQTLEIILQTVSENPSNLYEALEEKGYSKAKAWYYVPCLKAWGYLTQVGKGQYVLTEKGKAKLNRLLYGIAQCPMCGSNRVRLNGKRNGTGNQRFLCAKCRFTWTQGHKTQAVIRALKRQGKTIFILACNQRFSYALLNSLREWLKSDELGYLSKNLNLVIP